MRGRADNNQNDAFSDAPGHARHESEHSEVDGDSRDIDAVPDSKQNSNANPVSADALPDDAVPDDEVPDDEVPDTVEISSDNSARLHPDAGPGRSQAPGLSDVVDVNLFSLLSELAAELVCESVTDPATSVTAAVDIEQIEKILHRSSNQQFSLLSTRLLLSEKEPTAAIAAARSELDSDPAADLIEKCLVNGIHRCIESEASIKEALGSEFSYEDPNVSDDGFLIVLPLAQDAQTVGAVAAAGSGATDQCQHFFSVVAALIEHRLANHYLRSQQELILNEVIIAHSDLSSLELSADGLSHREQHPVSQAVRSSSEQFISACLNSPVGMLVVDRAGIIRHANRYVFDYLGYVEQELVGQNLSVLYGNTKDADIARRLSLCLDNFDQIYRHEGAVRRADGSWLQIRETSRIADGTDDHCIVVLQDVTDTYRRSRELEYRANHDGLTGLVNRVEFERRMEQAVRAVSLEGTSHTLCYLDLDHFKEINDSSGHNAGDEILKQMAKLFIGQIRQSDTIARLGGDEFAVLMEFCSLENAHRLAEDIRSAVETFVFEWQGRSFSTSVSIGMTTIEQADDLVADVMARADAACYAAKNAGRNQISVYAGTTTIRSNSPEYRRLIGLENAIENDGFEILRQPFDSTSVSRQDQLRLYEIQLRLPGPDGTCVNESELRSTVENGGLNLRLDDWTLNAVCRQIAENNPEPNECYWLKISRASLCDVSFADRLGRLLEKYNLNAARLCLSCTASDASVDVPRSRNLIQQIHNIGCQFALDEFGVSSSLDLPAQLKVDYCRLSKSLVERRVYSELDFAIIEAIVSVCRVADVETVAGHLHLQTQLDALIGSGSKLDYLQGDQVEAAALLSAAKSFVRLDEGSANIA